MLHTLLDVLSWYKSYLENVLASSDEQTHALTHIHTHGLIDAFFVAGMICHCRLKLRGERRKMTNWRRELPERHNAEGL